MPVSANGGSVRFCRQSDLDGGQRDELSRPLAWYILKATHSEMALGTFAVLQTVPAMLMLPFTGVVIDREDPRVLGDVAGCNPRLDHRNSGRSCIPAQGKDLATLSNEYAGGCWLFDIFAASSR